MKTVMVAEDNALLRDGIRLVLAEHNFDVVASVGNAEDLVAAVALQPPDLVVADVRMPPSHTDEGIRAALEIRSCYESTAVLVFSQWVETKYAHQLIAGDKGKVGYLLKDRIVDTKDFIAAANRVADGGTALDPDVVRQLMSRPDNDMGLASLSAREREILALVAEGHSNQSIADTLFLAIRSVEKVISSIFLKLDLPAADSAHRRVQAVLRFINADR